MKFFIGYATLRVFHLSRELRNSTDYGGGVGKVPSGRRVPGFWECGDDSSSKDGFSCLVISAPARFNQESGQAVTNGDQTMCRRG